MFTELFVFVLNVLSYVLPVAGVVFAYKVYKGYKKADPNYVDYR